MMAIARPILAGTGIHPVEVSAPWAVNLHSDDFVGGGLNVELKGAPTRDGSALYLTHVTMGLVHNSTPTKNIVAAALTLADEVGINVFGPIQLQKKGGGLFKKDWPEDAPLKLTDNKALDVTGVCSAVGYQPACLVYIEGFTGDAPIV